MVKKRKVVKTKRPNLTSKSLSGKMASKSTKDPFGTITHLKTRNL
jgi:hypothetical protein